MYSKKQKTSFQGTIFYQKKKKKNHTDTIHISWHKSRNLPYFPLRHWDVIHRRQVRYLWVTASAWKHVIFFPSFFPPFVLETGSHYVAQAEDKLTELSLCLPQPGKLFHFYPMQWVNISWFCFLILTESFPWTQLSLFFCYVKNDINDNM